MIYRIGYCSLPMYFHSDLLEVLSLILVVGFVSKLLTSGLNKIVVTWYVLPPDVKVYSLFIHSIGVCSSV